jgi:hypothetical protein
MESQSQSWQTKRIHFFGYLIIYLFYFSEMSVSLNAKIFIDESSQDHW